MMGGTKNGMKNKNEFDLVAMWLMRKMRCMVSKGFAMFGDLR